MKILVSILKYPPDFTGAGLRTKHMYHNLLDRGTVDQVYIITSREHTAPKNRTEWDQQEIRYVGFNPYVETQTTVLSKLKKANFVLQAGIRTIIQYFKTFRNIDIVHTIDSSWLSTIVGWCAFLTGKPFVKEVVLRGADDPLSIIRNKSVLWRRFFLFPFKQAKMVIVLSQKIKEACLRYGIPSQKIWQRYNPIYLETDAGVDMGQELLKGVDNTIPWILNVGRISRRKNTRFLLESAFHLSGEVQLLFVGPCEDFDYETEVHGLATKLTRTTNGRVKTAFLGRVTDRKKLSHLYRKSKLFWFASMYEGLPNVALESLLSGTPVLTLAVGGTMKEIIKNDQDGEVIETENPAQFADAANKWLRKADVDRFGIAERARQRFDPRIVENEYVTKFKQIIAS
jgi:starch synthase